MDEKAYHQTMVQMKEFFDGCAQNWDAHSRHDRAKLAAIATLAGVAPGMRVADIACGTGVMTEELLAHDPAQIVGIDISNCMIEHARRKFGQNERVKLLAADLLEVREKDFDLAMIYSAYPHFPDKPGLARHVYGMLKKGGRIMVAHSEGRDKINRHHIGQAVNRVSWGLQPAEEEAKVLSEFFSMDILVDTPELYIVSGIKAE